MQRDDRRLDGWKAIAAHIGRDRSTVIRWANERGLPVHAVPGGGATRTVYALAHELDAWLVKPVLDREAPLPLPAEGGAAARVPGAPAKRWRAKPILLACALLTAAVGVALLRNPPKSASASASGYSAALLSARDRIALRSPEAQAAALRDLRRMALSQPQNPRVHEEIAEGDLLSREFGTMADAAAFADADRHARIALALDPRSAVAWREVGFVAYWWRRDAAAAGRAFRRALALAPDDPLAALWYANALADAGEDRAAASAFARARTLSPGQPYLLADNAWGDWIAGHAPQAQAQIEELARLHPEVASIQDDLSVMAFARGDLAGYARHLAARAADRNAPALLTYSRLVSTAVARNAPHDVYRIMLTRALLLGDANVPSDHSWAAFVASSFGDRAMLATILRDAVAAGERWGSAGYRRRIAARWAGDRAIGAALERLAMPSLQDVAT